VLNGSGSMVQPGVRSDHHPIVVNPPETTAAPSVDHTAAE
jgi:hypothetical protein